MMAVFLVTEMKHYCSTLLPYANEQPVTTEQLPTSIFEANALYCARAHSSEIEWNRQAAAAQRSRQVGIFIINYLFPVCVCVCFRQHQLIRICIWTSFMLYSLWLNN